MTNPLFLHLATAVEDRQDALLNTWIIAWVGHALVTDPAHLFNTNIFYPYSNSLAFSEILLPQGLMALPINLASGNTVLGYNLVLLFSFLLAAYAMYLLVLDLTRSRGAGLVAGIIFAFNPYNLGNLAQIQLLSLGWLPLALIYLRRILAPENRETEFRYAFLFALFFSLQALSSIYYAVLAAIAIGFYVLGSIIAEGWPRIRLGRILDRAQLLRVFVRLVGVAFLAGMFTVPLLLPYLDVQRELGFHRKLEESEPFSASLKLYAEVSPTNVLYGRFLSPQPPVVIGNYPLDNLFPGLVALTLAALGISGRRRERWYYLALFALAFVLSLGPRLRLAPSVGTDIQLPYRWLYEAVPLIHALRAPVRFDALVMFSIAVLAGMGVQNAESRRQKAVGSRQTTVLCLLPSASCLMPSAFCLLLSGLVALEYLAVPAAKITPVPVGEKVPPYVRWLAQQPPGVVLELPMLASNPGEPPDLTAQYLSTYHWQRTPDGYSGFNPPKRGELAYEMQTFPRERTISLLQALGIRFVVLHMAQDPTMNLRLTAIEREPDLRLVQRFGTDYVYALAPRSQEASALQPSLYLPSPAAPSQRYEAFLILRNKGTHSIAVKPTDSLHVNYRWVEKGEQGVNSDASAARALAVALPLVTTKVSVVSVPLAAPERTGQYRLELHVSGLGQTWDLSGEVTVQNGEPVRQVVLPAQVEASFPLGEDYHPGDTVQVGLDWLALAKIDAYYSTSVRIVDMHGDKVSSSDRQPLTPTMYWTPDTRNSETFFLNLPNDLAAGDYRVQLLLYQADLGIDALLLNGDYIPVDQVTLATLRVN